MWNHTAAVKLLLERGAAGRVDPNDQTLQLGETPELAARRYNHVELADFIAQFGLLDNVCQLTDAYPFCQMQTAKQRKKISVALKKNSLQRVVVSRRSDDHSLRRRGLVMSLCV